MEVFGETEAVPPDLQRSDGLEKSFLVRFANTHDFAHGAHLSAQFVLNTLEFFEGPARKLDDHVIARRSIFFQGAFPPIGYFVPWSSHRPTSPR